MLPYGVAKIYILKHKVKKLFVLGDNYIFFFK
jgi:hypothetical protein